MSNDTTVPVANELADLLQGENDVNLSELQTLVDRLLTLTENQERLEEQAKKVGKEIETLRNSLIPEKMGHVTEIKLASGKTVKVQKVVRASISVANRETAIKWLEAENHGGLIKTEVTVALGREQRPLARQAVDALVAAGFVPEQSESVHPQTLSAWAREQLDNGAEIPECISVFTGKTVTVKDPKNAR